MRAHGAAGGDEGRESLGLEEVGARPDDRGVDEEAGLDAPGSEDLLVGLGYGPVPVVDCRDEVEAALDAAEEGVVEIDEVVAEGQERVDLGRDLIEGEIGVEAFLAEEAVPAEHKGPVAEVEGLWGLALGKGPGASPRPSIRDDREEGDQEYGVGCST